ncbi:MAG: VWA domain-containing protein [Labilithrix sp.]|nr:VWA domain-containing protein [Labilithrix sp.]MCW5811081.1 VWA domain-containing protein [Labilithrix sp.]
MRPRSSLVVALAGIAGALTLSAGCSDGRPPVAGDTSGGPPGGRSSTVFDTSDGGRVSPPGCGTRDDGTACECVDAPLFVDPPTIYFVLDRSGSMSLDDKWTQVRFTVANVMRSLGPRANFGAAVFPGRDEQCSAGIEVLPVTNGDPPSSTADGPATRALIAATAYHPNGGTPTASTLQAVHARLAGISGRRFVILATDGAPNCNVKAVCGLDQCQPNIDDFQGCSPNGPSCCDGVRGSPANCNDAAPTVAAIGSLRADDIPVFVVGLPGTQAPVYTSLLDSMAVAGGVANPTSPRFFRVDSASASAMLVALKKVAAKITATCAYDLKEPPKAPDLVNVYLDDVVLPKEPVNGWSLEGKTVTLLGNACDRVQSGDVLDVRIIAGCPTIEPK